uniref:Serine protease n=1 Tax=Thraustotheca clavata TaxID=74557 RepID=A0A0A7CLR2_9STRA|nr:secreted protein [Thraustotheca clavata]
MFLVYISVLLALVAARSSPQIDNQVHTELKRVGNAGGIEIYNRTLPLDRDFQFTIRYEGARFLYIYFSAFNLPPDASLVLSSANITQKYNGDHPGGFFAERIMGDFVNLQYFSPNYQLPYKHQYRLSVQSYIRGYSRIDGDDNLLLDGKCVRPTPSWKPASCYKQDEPDMYKSSLALARMVTLGMAVQYSTGFLLGCNGYFLTNEHNVRTQEQIDATDFGFVAQSSLCNDNCNIHAMGCLPQLLLRGQAKLIAVNTALDYTLVQFNYAAQRKLHQIGVKYLKARKQKARIGETIYMPQHPDGMAAQISSKTTNGTRVQITQVNARNSCGENQLSYNADTIGGSSGSPIISTNDHRVVGLHHCGECNAAKNDEDSEPTAIPIHHILHDLKRKHIQVPQCFYH